MLTYSSCEKTQYFPATPPFLGVLKNYYSLLILDIQLLNGSQYEAPLISRTRKLVPKVINSNMGNLKLTLFHCMLKNNL